MNVLMLLRSELRRSAAVLAGIAAVLALSLSISIATGMTDRMLRHASAQAADRFDLLIGTKASPSSLLLGAVFLRDEPLPLVPLSVMKDLDERHGVKWAAPVAFGDRAGDSPIVGTTTSLVTFGGTVRPAEGRLFKAPFEAVVVKPASFADAYRLRQQQSQRTLSGPDRTSVNLMGVFSGEVLVSLHSLLGGASEAVTITARLTLLTALAATLIMGVLLGELRRPALEQLRVLGAPQRYIMSLVWCIVMTVVAAGTAGGLVLGFIGAEAAAHLLAAETGVAMSPAMGSPELLAAAATLLAGSFCALIPAWLAGRRPIR